MKKTMAAVIAVGLMIIGIGCGGSSSNNADNNNVDTTVTEIGGVTPTDNTVLTNSQVIVLTFNESMDASTLVLGGTMGAASDGGVWSTTTSENDTLTIGPATTWSAGTQTLTVAVNDMEGNAFPAASVAKDAASGSFAYGVQTVYVRSGGTGDGTWASPMGDIDDAITQAATNLGDGTWATSAHVEVALGTYQVVYPTNHIVMSEGVSLYGAYSDTDWTSRDLAANTTKIKDVSAAVASDTNPSRAVEAGSGITNATVIDGFVIEGGSGSHVSGVYCFDGGSPSISRNDINGGTSNDKMLAGIFSYNGGSPKIFNNTISARGATESVAIGCGKSTAPQIYNNTIDGGDTNDSLGIYIVDDAQPVIANNIIFTSAGSPRAGIIEDCANCDPTKLQNNDIFDCPDVLYADDDGGGLLMTIGAIEADLQAEGITASGNVSLNPNFVDQAGGDLHFTGTVSGVTDGGLDGSAEGWGFTTDKNGNPRTAPWSMGAYEYD